MPAWPTKARKAGLAERPRTSATGLVPFDVGHQPHKSHDARVSGQKLFQVPEAKDNITATPTSTSHVSRQNVGIGERPTVLHTTYSARYPIGESVCEVLMERSLFTSVHPIGH